MFDLVVGFSYSQVLRAVIDSGLLPILREGPISLADIAARIDLTEHATATLVRAARSLQLAEEVLPDGWMLGEQGAVLDADPGTQAMIRHHRLLYSDLADPLALLRENRGQPTGLSTYWSYAGALHGNAEAGEGTHEYSELMAVSQSFIADQVLAAFSFRGTKRLLDVGGGHGAFVKRVGAAYPELKLGVFDLPQVIAGGETALVRELGPQRCSLHPGDFFIDSIPTGYDLISLVRILHDHDDEPAHALLANIRASLGPKKRLLIAEPMAQAPGAEAMGEAFFGLYLWAMGSGRPRSPDEIIAMLKRAGFSSARVIATSQPVIASMIVARA
ncbi:MAG: methyltransferase [Pseudomonadota bacterium]